MYMQNRKLVVGVGRYILDVVYKNEESYVTCEVLIKHFLKGNGQMTRIDAMTAREALCQYL
jgi:hypothetical protein